jgi:hypothetical protein
VTNRSRLLSFPLDIETSWNLSAANLSFNGLLESRLFTLIYRIDRILKLIGFEFLPAEIAALLPIIDIKDALIMFRGTNIFQVPAIPFAFFCLNTENITVPAGKFEAFNITILAGMGQCFYAPNAGNIIMLKGDIQEIIPFIKYINMELLETTYS